MATSRTGTARWKHIAHQRRHIARTENLQHCPLCGVRLDWERSRTPQSPEVDHIRPHHLGGPDTLDNTRIVCRLCNQQRHSRENRPENQRKENRTPTTTLIDW